jgi:two-component system sensor histidine kinase KdpD
MLNAALQQQMKDIDVVVAYVKTFINAGYSQLLKQLKQIPSDSEHSGQINIEAILQYKPQIVVIDDFHEHNPTGADYSRRYQEIQILLDAGIDVYSTLSIYSLESLADIVEKLIGIRVDKTVPDRLIDQARIELVDVAVETVLQRIQHKDISVSEPFQNKGLFTGQIMNYPAASDTVGEL